MGKEVIKNITEHSFKVEVAEIVGVNAAILFNNISHWCKRNETNSSNFFNDEYWTYNSIASFMDLFPYMSKKQIISALDKLKENGFIGADEFNKNPYDRTKWYCDLTRKVGLIGFLSSVPKGEMEIPKKVNVHLPKRGNSIPDNKQQIVNTDNKHLNINKEQALLFDLGNQENQPTNQSKTPRVVKGDAKKKSKAHPAHYPIKKFWFDEFSIGSRWMSGFGVFINEIIKNIEAEFSKKKISPSTDDIVEYFKVVCYESRKIPGNYYSLFKLKDFSSPSEFEKLVELIEKNKTNENGQRTDKNQQIADTINFYKQFI